MVAPSLRRPIVQTLPEQVYQILRSQIISHELRPGQALVEKQLADAMGISTTPVREALFRLEHDGLVTKNPYSGGRVAEISSSDIHAVCQVRAVLEGLAALLAAPNFSDADFDVAAECIETSEVALPNGDYELCAEKGRAFHALIARSAANRVLEDHLEHLMGHSERIRNITSRVPYVSKDSIAGHRRVFEALRRRDGPGAEQAMRQHITGTFLHLTPEAVEAALTELSAGQLLEVYSGRR